MNVEQRYKQLNDIILLKKKHNQFSLNDPIDDLLCQAISISAKQVNSYNFNYDSQLFSVITVPSKANIY